MDKKKVYRLISGVTLMWGALIAEVTVIVVNMVIWKGEPTLSFYGGLLIAPIVALLWGRPSSIVSCIQEAYATDITLKAVLEHIEHTTTQENKLDV